MKTIIPEALLLLLLAYLAMTRHPEGLHSVSYMQTLLTWPDPLEPQFILSVTLDDIPIERFNSREVSPRVEHCAPWVAHQPSTYWDKRTRDTLVLMEQYQQMLSQVLQIYNDSETGYHTMQILIGCDVLTPGGFLKNGQLKYLFDGHDYMEFNVDLGTWTAFGTAAEILIQGWNHIEFAKNVKKFMENDCVNFVLHQLGDGKKTLLRTDSPKTYVTHKVRADGRITLRCWATNFYPAEISLTWQRDGSNKTPKDMEVIETRPAGDGTFQKWAAVVVPSGEEQRYTCHVNHQGLPEPVTLKWEPPQSSVPIMPIVTGLVLGAVVVGAVVTFLIWKRRTKG